MAEGKPTARREQFIAAYLGSAHGNASEAARQAGYKKPAEEGYRLLKNAQVRARIDAELEARTMRQYEVLDELTAIARIDWRSLARAKELGSKVKALELLGKYHKLFTEKVEATSNVLVREYVDDGDG